MTTNSTAPIASFTLDKIKGLGPAENLQAVQQTTRGAPSVSVGSKTAQTPKSQPNERETQSNDQKSNSDLPDTKAESEQAPNVSESEDEHSATPRALNISERRKVQNNKFSAWCVLRNEIMALGVKAYPNK